MHLPINTPLPELPCDPGAIESFIVWRLNRLRQGQPVLAHADTAFSAFGIDSLEAITLIGEIEQAVGRQLDSSVFFDCPTPRALARHLAAAMNGRERSPG